MGTYRGAKVLAVVMSLTLLGAACGDDDDDDAATTTAADGTTTVQEATTTGGEGEPEAVTIVANDYAFSDAPSELAAGVVELTFENAGQVEHELALIEIGDTPIDEVGTALAPVLEGGPFPDFLENVSIPAVADSGATVETTALLAAGDYALICTLTGVAPAEGATTTMPAEGAGGEGEGEEGPPHYELGMVQPLTVTAGDGSTTLPEADSTITASDYAFDVDVSAGDQTVAFVNEGPDQVHHAVFFPFAEGIDEAAAGTALTAFLSSEEEGPPPPEFDFEAQTFDDFGVFSAGLGATYEASFESGRTYAVVCFIQDRSGGPPHAIAHDMTEVFTVE